VAAVDTEATEDSGVESCKGGGVGVVVVAVSLFLSTFNVARREASNSCKNKKWL
jgi:hypothetical protein